MSYYYYEYEFVGQDSAGSRGGEVQIQVITARFLLQVGTSRWGIPWGDHVPIAIPVEKLLKFSTNGQFPVPNSMCPGWLLRARPRAREPVPTDPHVWSPVHS